ncbi:bifunctional hydroxymethylpyrimidine kinase/phosphomethylpyrimidine kinase [Lachnospiraceae bacterium 54-53]
MSLILPSVLTIAGSDSSGGAGIQADLKTIAALGLYGSSVITALTAQNTTGVFLAETVGPEMLAAQLDAVFTDIPPNAVKVGMAGTPSSIEIIAEKLLKYPGPPVIVDPVMLSTSGHILSEGSAVASLAKNLFPTASLVTPNLPEAEVLLSDKNLKIRTREDMEEAVKRLSQKFHTSFLLKGGHSARNADDVLCHRGSVIWFPGTRISNSNNHGTGCTLSSAIACKMAEGMELEESIFKAKEYITGALKADLNLGIGNGPLWHGWKNDNRTVI